MAVYQKDGVVTRNTEFDKCTLKLLGIGNSEGSNEKILEILSKYILPSSIKALLFDPFNKFYVLFLTDMDSVCCLVGKTLKFEAYCIEIYPLLDCFWIDNVYPCVSNSQLRDIFKSFGKVFKVSYRCIVPNSAEFSHVLSGQREITFVLPGKERKVCIPLNVINFPYVFNVRRFCCACLEKNHSVLYCPAFENDLNSQIIKCEGSENDSELKGSTKSQEFHSYENFKVENPVDSDDELEIITQSEEFHAFKNYEDSVDSDDELEIITQSEEFHAFKNYEDSVDSNDELEYLIQSEEFRSFDDSKIEDPASEPQARRHSHRLSRRAGKS